MSPARRMRLRRSISAAAIIAVDGLPSRNPVELIVTQLGQVEERSPVGTGELGLDRRIETMQSCTARRNVHGFPDNADLSTQIASLLRSGPNFVQPP